MKIKAMANQKVLLWVTVFSIAMAYLESAVVVYLRMLYFPSGFGFPIPPMEHTIVITELGREFATIVMLIAISVIISENPLQRFGYFLYSFAFWDIFYYIFLWLLIQWPISLFEWDVLFLIPVVWVSPVICPLITSVSMIILALFLIIGVEKNKKKLISGYTWLLLILGSFIILLSFTLDYLFFIFNKFDLRGLFISFNNYFSLIASANYSPEPFNWILFTIGESIIIGGIIKVALNYFRHNDFNKIQK